MAPSAPGAVSSEIMDGVDALTRCRVGALRLRCAARSFKALVNESEILTNFCQSPWKFFSQQVFLSASSLRAGVIARMRSTLRSFALADSSRADHSRPVAFQGSAQILPTFHGTDLLGFQGRLSKVNKIITLKSAFFVSVVIPEMLGSLAELGFELDRCRVQLLGLHL